MSNANKKILIGASGFVLLFFVAIFAFSGGRDPSDIERGASDSSLDEENGYIGDKGDAVEANGEEILIKKVDVSDGNLHAFNYYSGRENKTIYFFVVKAGDDTYRVAANACEVCYDAQKGFSQVGDKIKCNNCGQDYTKDQIAKEKGGCNPRPITDNARLEGENIVVNVSDVEDSAELF